MTPSGRSADVAVIVRTKDRPQMLRRALGSILAQSSPDWQLVIVNDGGDPQAVDAILAEHHDALDGRADVVHHRESLGRWPSANAGVLRSSAPLLVLHDDDDSWHPEFLEVCSGYLAAHHEERGVIARTEVILEEPKDGTMVETGRYVLEDHNPEVTLADLLDFNRFVPIAFVYRRTLHDEIGLYDDSLPAAGDWAFNMKVLTLQPIRYASEKPLAYWHQRPGVQGVEGNSVFAAPVDHRIADRRHRDEALREYVRAQGPGLALYLAYALEDLRGRHDKVTTLVQELTGSIDRLERSLSTEFARVHHDMSTTLDARARRWVRRQRTRIGRRSRHEG